MWRWGTLALVGVLGGMQDATGQDVCVGVDEPPGCIPQDCTAVDQPYEGCIPQGCNFNTDTPYPGCIPDDCGENAFSPYEGCIPADCTTDVFTPYEGCNPAVCQGGLFDPYEGCIPQNCTGVEEPYPGCIASTCTGVEEPYPGCIVPDCSDLVENAQFCEAVGCMYIHERSGLCEGESAEIPCEDIGDEGYCMAMGCTFTAGIPRECAQRPQCEGIPEEILCPVPGCTWWQFDNEPGFCRDDCNTFYHDTSCSGTDGCFWAEEHEDHFCTFRTSGSDDSSESNSGDSIDCVDEAAQRLLRLEEEPGICALRSAEASCESWVESVMAANIYMGPGTELLVTGCTRAACEAAGYGWFDDGSHAGTCTYLAHVDALKSAPPPGYAWQEARTICLSNDPPLMWMTETEVSLRAQLRRRDWASDAEQMQKDRVSVIDQLRKKKTELEKTVETLTGLLQMANGRRCLGPQ